MQTRIDQDDARPLPIEPPMDYAAWMRLRPRIACELLETGQRRLAADRRIAQARLPPPVRRRLQPATTRPAS